MLFRSLKTPISAPSVLWYLWFLSAFYIIALVLLRLSVPLLPVIVLCVIASGFLPSVLRIDRFAALLAFFLAGHLVVTHRLTERLTGRIGAPLALLGLAAALVGGTISALGTPIKYDPLFIWVPFGLIVFVLWGSAYFTPTAVSAPLEWIGRNSIVFYASHFGVLVATAHLIDPDPRWNGSLFYGLLFAWALAVGAGLQAFRERVPIGAALFDFRPILMLLNVKPRPSPQRQEK